MTMGIVLVACWAAGIARESPRHDDVYLELDQLGGKCSEPLITRLRKAPFNHEVLSLKPAQLA